MVVIASSFGWWVFTNIMSVHTCIPSHEPQTSRRSCPNGQMLATETLSRHHTPKQVAAIRWVNSHTHKKTLTSIHKNTHQYTQKHSPVYTKQSHTQKHSPVLVGCLTSQQHASVSQGRICSDKCTCCHTDIEVADQTFYLTQSQHTDIGPTSPSADPITPGAWQCSHWSANFYVTGMTRPGKSRRKWDSNPKSAALEADALTTRPTRQYHQCVDPKSLSRSRRRRRRSGRCRRMVVVAVKTDDHVTMMMTTGDDEEDRQISFTLKFTAQVKSIRTTAV